MPIKAGQIDIEIRAAATRLRADMDESVKQVKRIGPAGQEAGKELAKGMDLAVVSVGKVAKVAAETVVALEGAALASARFAAANAANTTSTEGLIATLRALRIAASAALPATFGSVAFASTTVGLGILAEATVRLVQARAKLIEQQSLIAATAGMPIAQVQRIDAVTGISGGNSANVRNLSGALSERMNSNPLSVRTGMDSLGIPQSQGGADDPARLEHIAAGFASIEDPAKRAAAAVRIFGAANAGIALQELDSRFAEASAAATKYGITLDQLSRNQIYQMSKDFKGLYDWITDFSDEKAWVRSFVNNTEEAVAAAYSMVKRIGDLPGVRLLTQGTMSGPEKLSDAELRSGAQRRDNISVGLTADEIFAHEQALARNQAGTLEGQRSAQSAAQSQADTAFGTLSADAKKRSDNPNDTSLLSNTQRLSLAVQQQTAAALATAIAEKVKAMEDAAAAQKEAQRIAEQLAEYRGKAGDRLQALSDQVTGKAMADDPVSAARFDADLKLKKLSSDGATPAELSATARILAIDVARVQVKEEQLKDERIDAAAAKEIAELPRGVNPLAGFIPTRESSRDAVRLDDEAETRQRDAGERSIRGAGIQSQPGDETALAQTVLNIRLQTVASERDILKAHADQYTLEDRTLAAEKLNTEELNAQLTYQNSIAEIEKSREQLAIGAGGAYQQQLRSIQQQQDALNQIVVSDKNALDVDLARVALAQKQAQLEIDQLLALGTLKDGLDAFWIGMETQAEKPGKILFDGMNSALDKATADLTKLITGQRKQANFGKDMESVGRSMTQASVKSAAQYGLGQLGKHLGVKSPTGKPDGTAANPYHVVINGSGEPSLKAVPYVPGGSGSAASGAAVGAAAGGIGGLFHKLIGLFGGGSGGGTAVDSNITFMAAGGDADPGKVYGVGEAGEAELISPKNSSRITPLSKLNGGGRGDTHIAVDARGAGIGVEHRVALAVQMAHDSAVQSGVRANAERAQRTPKRSS